MSLERVALGALTIVAIIMGINYVSAAGRFLDANRAYDGLELTLEEFTFRNAESPVYVELTVTNPSGTDIDVLALQIALRAGLQLVGSGELYVEEVLRSGESRTYEIPARINDRSFVSAIVGNEIEWLIRGDIQVRLDTDVPPVWIQFSVRTVTS